MPCVITDLVSKFDNANVPQPVQYASVYAVPAIVPVFVKASSTFREAGAFLPRVAATDVTGMYTFTLPWPSEQDPALTNWIITLPDESRWMGLLPEGVAGPLTIHDLKELYGWGLITTTHEKWVPAAIQGPRGLRGADGVALWNVSSIQVGGDTYTASANDFVRCNATAGNVGVILPDANGITGKQIAVKDVGGGNTSTGIKVNTSNGQLIDGQSFFVLNQLSSSNNFAEVTFISDGANWMIGASYAGSL